jgi:lambda family phage tail tape measure protein
MADNLKAQIAISADATGVEAGVAKAKRSLVDLGTSAASAGKKASDGVEPIGTGTEKASAKVDRATRNIIGSIERTTAALAAGGRNTAQYYEQIAQQRGVSADVLRPYLQALDAASVKQKLANREVAASVPVLEKAGISARQTAAALRGVPAQFTDIATSLAAGQNPITVFLQQGGQLKDMFGGIGPAARALGGYLKGLVNPFSIAAAAAGLLAVAAHKGSEETVAYTKAIVLSGNAAGVTAGQLAEMAQRIGSVTGTQAAAAQALAEFTASGAVAAKDLERFAQVALQFQRAGGEAVAETVKKFADLGKSPVEASIKLNESLNYLTVSTYAQIKALQSQGREAEAAALAQKTYADAMEGRTQAIEASLGLVERAWRGVKDVAAGAWDSMLGIGRQESVESRLAKVAAEIEKGRGKFDVSAFGGNAEARARLSENLALQASLSKQLLLQDNVATSAKAAADQVKARIDFDKAGEQFLTDRVKMEREIAKARADGIAAGKTQEEIEQRISLIREKLGKGDAAKATQEAKARLALDLENIRSLAEQRIASAVNADRILEAQRAAGLVSERKYYEDKRALIDADSSARAQALQQEIDRLSKEKLAGKDKLDNERQLVRTTEELAKVRGDAAVSQAILSIQEADAARRSEQAFRSMRVAAQEYLDLLNRQQSRSLGGMGQGDQRRNFEAGIAQIDDDFDRQRREVESLKAAQVAEQRFGEEQQREYSRRIALLDQYHAKALASFDGYYTELLRKQADWSVGASEALNNYIAEAGNAAKQTESLFTRAFNGMEDALADLVLKGKADFKSLANAIIADLIRVQARAALAGLAKLFQGGFSGAASGSSTSSTSPVGDVGDAAGAGRVIAASARQEVVALQPARLNTLSAGGNTGRANAGGPTFQNTYHITVGGDMSRGEVFDAVSKAVAASEGRTMGRMRAAGVA